MSPTRNRKRSAAVVATAARGFRLALAVALVLVAAFTAATATADAATTRTYDYDATHAGTAAGLALASATDQFAADTVTRCLVRTIHAYDDPLQLAGLSLRLAGYRFAPQTTGRDDCDGLTLYRAVEPPELQQIISDGYVYRVLRGMGEGKYFFPTREQAANFARLHPNRDYTLTSAVFPRSIFADPASGHGDLPVGGQVSPC